MEKIITPPTPEIKRVCVLLQQLIHHFLNPPVPHDLGEYEFKIESFNLIALIIRDVESITVLGKHDLVLLPSAMNLARSILEKSVKILWMLEPEEPFNREVRWLAQLQTEENYYDRISRRMNELGIDNQHAINNRDVISEFRIGVTERLPEPYKPLERLPDLSKMMAEVGEADKYPTYMFLSQYMHGTHVATGTYRRGLGIYKELGEYTSPEDWTIILDVCKYCLVRTFVKFIQVLDGDVSANISEEIIREIDNEIEKIKKTKSRHRAGEQV